MVELAVYVSVVPEAFKVPVPPESVPTISDVAAPTPKLSGMLVGVALL